MPTAWETNPTAQRRLGLAGTGSLVCRSLVGTENLPQKVRKRPEHERNRVGTEWVYGFKVTLSITPGGVITAFGLAPANCDERPIGDFLISSDRHDGYLADKGFPAVEWERHWLERYGALIAATPQRTAHWA